MSKNIINQLKKITENRTLDSILTRDSFVPRNDRACKIH